MPDTQTSKVRPWLVWGSAGLFTMFQFMMQGSPSVMIPDLIASFGIDTTQVGFLTTYFFYTYIFMQIPSGALVDIFGPKVILLIGCISAATACIIFSKCTELWMAKSTRLFMGLMCAPGIVSTLTLASRWFDRRRFALVVGFTETLCMVGAACGMIILAYFVHHFGWRTGILLCGFVGYFVALLILIFVRNFPPEHANQKISLKNVRFKEEIMGLWIVLKEFQAWLAGIFSGLSFAIISAYLALWSVPFLMNRFHISTTAAASITSVGFIGAGIGGPTIGWLSDKIKRRKAPMVVGSFISLGLILIIIYLQPSRPLTYLLTFLLGFCISSYVLAFAIVSELFPTRVKGKAMGFTNTLTLLIGAPLLQPLIGSYLKHNIEPESITITEFDQAFIFLPCALALAFILSFFIKETHCAYNPEL